MSSLALSISCLESNYHSVGPWTYVSKFISPSTKLLSRKIEAIPTKCQAISLDTFDFHNKQKFPSFGGCLKEKVTVFIFFTDSMFHTL